MIKLWEKNTPYFDAEKGQPEPVLVPYLLEDRTRPCVIVFPGGAYSHRAYHEGEPVAQWLNSIGIQSFVLEYRVAPYDYHAILGDALRAVRLVRYHAAAYKVDPEKIGTLGFSAGGHLAAMTAVHYDMAELHADDPIDSVSSRPNCAVLCYPVLSFLAYHNAGTCTNFLQEAATWENRVLFSAEEAVTKDTPPIFLWHTCDDPSVPVENSLRMAMALRAKRVPFSLHVYPNGQHGTGLAKDLTQTCEWSKACGAWLRELFEMEEK